MTITAIMGAMPDEVEQLCALLDGVTVEPYAGVVYHRGLLGEKPVVVCCAGMGKANAAATCRCSSPGSAPTALSFPALPAT